MIAALFVQTNGCYWHLDDVDPWDEKRDARLYAGPHPVVAHPPCERWGRYWSGGPSLGRTANAKTLGDDGGCFSSALHSVGVYGGVLEHPEASRAWYKFGLPVPPRSGGWVQSLWYHGWTCCVEQGHYGHPARKATWLFCSTPRVPDDLIWGPSSGVRLDEGFHSKTERDAARAAGRRPVKRLSKAENIATPIAFRDVLIAMAGKR